MYNDYDQYGRMYDTSYASGASSGDMAGFVAAMMVFFMFYMVFIIALYVVNSIFLGKIFQKAGVPSWIAWVPVYNFWKMLEIGGQKGWISLLLFVPLVNIVAAVYGFIAMFHIGRKLGKEDWFILIGIFLNIVWTIWLGADSSKWDESKGAPRTDTPVAPAAAPAAPVEAAEAPVEQPSETTPPKVQ